MQTKVNLIIMVVEIAFYGKGIWSFGVDNTSSSHPDNQKKYFLVLGEGPIKGIKDSVGATEKKVELTLVKER